MSLADHRPDPKTVSHEAVATIAQERAGGLFQEVILRDAKIREQQSYITALEGRLAELEQQPAPVPAAPVAAPQTSRPRRDGEPAVPSQPEASNV